MVFDLGGGTYDITILQIIKNEGKIFNILSTNGDKFLGGEDFDNKLVEYILDKFCKKTGESKEEIKKDKKCIRSLKINCEIAKKVLSNNHEATLFISNFYNKNNISQIIKRSEFERLCSDLFKRLKKPIDDALSDAKIKKDEISEIILVGGSSRIPKIKEMLKTYFNINSNKKGKSAKTIIKDSINPDEVVAYGATLNAAKILNQISDFKEFVLNDIIPFSLGVEVLNNDPEKQKEGNLMSVIIKKGSNIPIINNQHYKTVEDNQTSAKICIYEGEYQYIKYNHILGEFIMTNLPKRKKGELKINIELNVDTNGILYVRATETINGESKEITIKNDTVGLTEEELEEIKKKNQKLFESITTKGENTINSKKLKKELKEVLEAYEESDDLKDKYDILIIGSRELEKHIDLFGTNFDNETLFEKYYLYIEQLFNFYIKILCMKGEVKKEDEITIIKKIKKYIERVIEKNILYLDNLVRIINKIKEQSKEHIFYEIIIYIFEELKKLENKCSKT